MRHLRNAEKLLGGYATGILTGEEKTTLYSAALKNQELFDALADEEALRELLADPSARQHLLKLLGDSAAEKPIPFWRRPALLGLAASLFAMVGTSVVLWQREHPLPSVAKEKIAAQPITTAPTPAAAPASVQTRNLVEKTEAKDAAAKPASPSAMLGHTAPPEMAPMVQPSVSSAAGSLADRALPMKIGAEPSPRAEMKKATFEKPQAAEAETIANLSAMEKNETAVKAGFFKEDKKGFSAARAKSAPPFGTGSAKDSRKMSAPSEVMERLENGKVRLTVTRSSGDFVYLLKRTPANTVSITPTKTIPSIGTTIDTFEFFLEAQDHLDLYLLTQPATDPRALPPNDAVAGRWKRLQ